mgnify:CR=1 FL=1
MIYDYQCGKCHQTTEAYVPTVVSPGPSCCGEVMTRVFTVDVLKIKMKYPLWVDRMDDIHKAQEQRGERLRYVHPKEIGAT